MGTKTRDILYVCKGRQSLTVELKYCSNELGESNLCQPSSCSESTLAFFLQIISSASPCADFFFQSLSSEFKRTHVQSHTHASQRAAKQSFDETVRLIQRCSEVDLNIVVLWKVRTVVADGVIWP